MRQRRIVKAMLGKSLINQLSMFFPSDEMTAVPISSQSPFNSSVPMSHSSSGTKAVLALKEMIALLHREQNKIQNLLSSLGFALRSFNNLNQFLALTPLMAARVTEGDAGILVLYKGNGQITLEHIYAQDSRSNQSLKRQIEEIIRGININNSPCTTQLSLSLPDCLDYQMRQSFTAPLQCYGTPILVKNTEKGRLYVFSQDPDYIWTQTRRKLLQLVADQTAVAIANNELTMELRSKERQDRELEIASEIQLRLLPRKCPKIEGVELSARCKTANRVGGDYYDFIPTNYDQIRESQRGQIESTQSSVPWSIVIGDVMGKGVPAGLLMTMTRGMLRAEVLNRHSPAQILQHLNQVMYSDLENSHRFVTLFYSEYDPHTKILSYSNAAHNPPLLWKAAKGSVERLDTDGMLIGLDSESVYEDAQIQLASGDILIYYTDGFTDAVNQNNERFEEENLIRAFQLSCERCDDPQKILEFLFAQVQSFIGAESSNRDDMTLVVMRVV